MLQHERSKHRWDRSWITSRMFRQKYRPEVEFNKRNFHFSVSSWWWMFGHFRGTSHPFRRVSRCVSRQAAAITFPKTRTKRSCRTRYGFYKRAFQLPGGASTSYRYIVSAPITPFFDLDITSNSRSTPFIPSGTTISFVRFVKT